MANIMKIFLLGLLIASSSVFASLYPVITSVRLERNLDRGTFYFTQKIMDIGSAGDVIIPPNYGMGLGIRLYETHDLNDTISYVSSMRTGDNKKTASELAMDVYNSDGKSLTFAQVEVTERVNQCVGYMAAARIEGRFYRLFDGSIRPAGCLVVPPSGEWCKITTPELVLDHGKITLQEAEGSIASTVLGLQCTTDMAVSFNLITQDKYVYLDDGKSEITVDNKPLNTKIDLKSGNSQLPINDLLTGVTKEGFHSGSSVLVMMPY